MVGSDRDDADEPRQHDGAGPHAADVVGPDQPGGAAPSPADIGAPTLAARVGRRGLLLGAAAVAGAAAVGAAGVWSGVLPGRGRLERLLGACGDDPGLPDVEPGPRLTTTFDSAARGREVGCEVAWPPGYEVGDPLPVCLVMHGAGGDAAHAFEVNHGLDSFLAQCTEGGGKPFVLAAVDGGELFWHPRESGDDPLGMVADDLPAFLGGELGLDTTHVLIHGWGTGGYGALLLADRFGPERVLAVASLAPALYHSYEEAIGYAYDDRTDFERHDAFQLVESLSRHRLRVDCGADDPFAPAVRDFRSRFDPAPEGGIQPGCREMAYWHRARPAIFDFLATALP